MDGRGSRLYRVPLDGPGAGSEETTVFYHVVLMQFTAEAHSSFLRRVDHYVDRVRAECPDVLAYDLVGNVAARGDGLTHGIVGTFASSAAHDAYQVSPAHQEMKAYMSPFLARIVVLDGEPGR